MLGESGKPCPGKATQTLFIASLTEMNCTGFLGALSLPDDWGGAAAVQPWAGNTLVSIFFLLEVSAEENGQEVGKADAMGSNKCCMPLHTHDRLVFLSYLL